MYFLLASCAMNVEDNNLCEPITTMGAYPMQLDSRGCPFDTDQDGVPDHRDLCPYSSSSACSSNIEHDSE